MNQVYTQKRIQFEAYRYAGPAVYSTGQALPTNPQPWLTFKTLGFDGERYPYLRSRTAEGLLAELPIRPGDWIVLAADNRNRVLTDPDFQAAFEVYVEAPQPAKAPPVEVPGTVSAPPYVLVDLQYGSTMRPTKKFPNGMFGDVATDEEIALCATLKSLAQENARLSAAVEAEASSSPAKSSRTR